MLLLSASSLPSSSPSAWAKPGHYICGLHRHLCFHGGKSTMWCVMDPQVLHAPGAAAPHYNRVPQRNVPAFIKVSLREGQKKDTWLASSPNSINIASSLQVFSAMTISFDTDITRDSGCISYHCSTDKTTPSLLQQRLLANLLAVHSSNVGSVLTKPSSSLTQVSLWLPQKISECHCTSWCSFVPMVPWWLTPCDSYHQSYHPRDV